MRLLLVFILVFSCTDYSEVKESISGSHIIDPEPLEIESTENHTYNVGKEKLTVLSKGIQTFFKLPLIDIDVLSKLQKKYRFDSWIYEVIRKKNGRLLKLHTFYVPFTFKREEVISQAKKSGFFLMYSALYPAPHLEKHECPIMGHNKFIAEAEVTESYVPKSFRIIDVSSYNVKSYNGYPEKANYSLNKVNAGTSLVGEYYLRLALFNQRKNKVISNFIDYPNKIIISKEDSRLIKGCNNRQYQPIEEPKKPGIDSFKFGN